MATDPPADLLLAPVGSQARTLRQWLTTFQLCAVVVDPFTYESSWLLETADRLLRAYAAADVRVAWLVTATADEATQFLGPHADGLLVFADPDRTAVKALGLDILPALVHINGSGALEGVAEGWDPVAWRAVCENLSRLLHWTVPVIPQTGDPTAYAGSAAT